MEEVLKSEIFFFTATVALIAVSLVFLVAFFYAIRIFRNLKEISDLARKEAQLLSEDLNDLRTKVKNEGSLWGGARTFWKSVFGSKGRK